jgi:hypothetical protein
MKINLLFVILGAIIFNSCQVGKYNKSAGEFPIAFEKKHVTVKDDECKGKIDECTGMDVEYFEFAEPRGYVANLLTSQMIQFIAGLPIQDTIVSAENTAHNLIQHFVNFKKEFPDSKQFWYVSMKSQISYNSKKLLSIEMITGSYLGGAHGDFRHSFLTINNNGERVHIIDFVTDLKKFAELAEKKFRELRGLKKDQSLNTGGYFFPDGKFILPEGIGLNEQGFILYYNVYEIAPFYIGGTEVVIPYAELDGMLKEPLY